MPNKVISFTSEDPCPCCAPAGDCCAASFAPNGDSSSLTIGGASPSFTLAATTSNSTETLSLGFLVGACVNLLAGSILTLSVSAIDAVACEAGMGFMTATLSATDPDGNPMTPATDTGDTVTYEIPSDGCYCGFLQLTCAGLTAGPVGGTLTIASDMAIGCDAITPPP